MNTSTTPSVETILAQAVEIAAPAERQAFVDEACAGDSALQRQIERLIANHFQAGSFLERPAVAMELGATVGWEPAHSAEGPGTVIGPYKLLEQIGEGGMGVVYVAEQILPMRRKLALKIIKPGMDTKQVVARFEAERQALAMMDHPNIARVHDGGATESGRPYFVMELVRGIPITDYCDREQLSISERLELFVLVCRAVQHAHQKGIIHRDLKPSNILVTVIDGVAVPKIIDFGVAKATGVSLTERSIHTGFHQFIGTPLYMSPEQADLSGVDVDTRSDIYSLGVLLYELLTGTTPFDSETLKQAAFDELRRIIREEEPPKPSTRLVGLGATLTSVSAKRSADPRRLDRAVRGELDWIAMKALEKDRRRRYETANDFASDVMRCLTDQPVEACPPSRWYRFTKYARRNRTALATTSLVAVALVTGTAVSLWQAVRATRAEAQAATRAEETGLVLDYLVEDVFGAARPDRRKGRTLTALELLTQGETSISGRFAGRPLVEASARLAMGDAFLTLGRAAEAENQFRRAAQKRAALLGREHALTLAAETNLVDALAREGYQRYTKKPEAETLARRVLEARLRGLGPDDPVTLYSMNQLANILRLSRGYDEALSLIERAYPRQTRVLGPEHVETLMTLDNMAGTLSDLGRHADALGVYRRLIAARVRSLGPDAYYTHLGRQHMAHELRTVGRLDEAIPLMREALEGLNRFLGPTNPDFIQSAELMLLMLDEKGDLLLQRDFREGWLRQILAAPADPSLDPDLRQRLSMRISKLALRLATMPEPIAFDAVLATRAAEQSVALDGASRYAKSVLAVVYYRTGEFEQAAQAMQTLMERPEWKGGNDFDWLVLALIHARRGELDQARAWYDKARNRPAPVSFNRREIKPLRDEAEALLAVPR